MGEKLHIRCIGLLLTALAVQGGCAGAAGRTHYFALWMLIGGIAVTELSGCGSDTSARRGEGYHITVKLHVKHLTCKQTLTKLKVNSSSICQHHDLQVLQCGAEDCEGRHTSGGDAPQDFCRGRVGIRRT